MTKPPHYWKKAKNYLSSKDKVMKNLIKRYDDTTLSTRKDVFYSLCKSIIGQQISVAAANSVFSRFEKSCKGKINAKIVSTLSTQSLKRCGLSRQKVRGIKDLAKKLQAEYDLSDKNTFVGGMSNGGFMSYTLACERSDTFKAIASVTGTMSGYDWENCNPNKVPVELNRTSLYLGLLAVFVLGILFSSYFFN